MENIVQIFKALGDETRLKILIILSKRNICAKGLAKHLGISEAAVSQHLKVLKEAGIIAGEKVGYYVHYTLQEAVLSEAVKCINEINTSKDFISHELEVNIMEHCNVICKTDKNKCCRRS